MALGVVMPVTASPETPGLLPVKEPGEKPLATTTCGPSYGASRKNGFAIFRATDDASLYHVAI